MNIKNKTQSFDSESPKNGFLALLTIIAWILLILTILFLGVACYFYITEKPIEPIFKSAIKMLHIGESTWDWIAVSIACLSLFYACLTFNSQRKTEHNTKKITTESQREILIDYVRHFYCNLIVICAVEAKLNKRFNEYYPSEEHLLKLKVDTADLNPDSAAFTNNLKEYKAIHELLLKVRNYNTEVDVAVKHLCSRNVFPAAKQRDLDTLKFKMDMLTNEIVKSINVLWPKNETENVEALKTLIKTTAYTRNMTKRDLWKRYNEIFAGKYPYYSNKNSFFVKTLFKEKEEYDDFLCRLNYNIYVETRAKNTEGSDKIFLIPFE